MGEEKEYTLKYHHLVPGDLQIVDSFWRKRISTLIEDKLVTEPGFFGKPLRHSLKGCRSLRVGDYRIVYKIDVAVSAVRILIIGHRKDVYKSAEKRFPM